MDSHLADASLFQISTSLELLFVLGCIITIYVYLQPSAIFNKGVSSLSKDNRLIISTNRFLTRSWSLLQRTHDKITNQKILLPRSVVGLSGHAARDWFYNNKELNFSEGYLDLFVGLPRAECLQKEEHVSEGMHNHFLGHLASLLKTSRVAATLPHILHDTERYMDVLAADPERYINAFDGIETLAFQLMTRSVVCDEIAEDQVLLSKACNLFTSIAKHATPFMVSFPSIPCPGHLRRIIAGLQLYRILSTITNERRSNGKRANDPLQYLMDQGESNLGIFKVAIGGLAGGLPHLGNITTWVLLHLAADPSWHARALEEIGRVAGKYNSDPSTPLSEQLLSVPLEGWDSDFPLLNTCLNESVRLNIVGKHFRRNSSIKTFRMDNAIIAPGAYVVYHLTDTHQDPQLYPNPLQWDPARFESGRREFEQSKYGFIGWGAGRHLCPGQRLARLNFKVMISFFLARFDFELCNSEGEVGEVELPNVDLNARHVYKPKEGIYIKYKERDERIYRRQNIELS